MQTAFRWFGPSDPVPLAYIRQMMPRPQVVTHLPNRPPGDAWSVDDLRALKSDLDAHDLGLGPVESVFWSDAMKLGLSNRDRHIENYCQTLRNLRQIWPDEPEILVTYNLMPLDWGRTDTAYLHPNGARGLAFDQAQLASLWQNDYLFLPGWGKGYHRQEFRLLQEQYAALGEDGLWANVKYALDAIVPAAEETGIVLAAHPNDPPWPTFDLPALLCDTRGIRRLLSLNSSSANALCFCTGSYGALPENDVCAMIAEFKSRVAWLHLRATKTTGPQKFHEADHADPDADVDLLKVMRTLVNVGWDGTFRSDHGLDLLHETHSGMRGYPAIDRYAANKLLWGYWRALVG